MKNCPRHGMILMVVLVVIALCTLAAVTFSELMMTEREASELALRKAQTRASTDSGLEMARVFLTKDSQTQIDAGGWYDNPQMFQGVLVVDNAAARRRARFSLLAPAMQDGRPQGIRFGLEDESTRLNLNLLPSLDRAVPGGGRQILMGLPGMTEEIADAILDWLDQDDEPREYGAEVDSYSTMSPPYAPKNGPLETVEELLLVRGVTPQLLFGVDANRNGFADAGEPASETIVDADNSDRSMDRGWAAYLTLHSTEANVQPDGTPRININQQDVQTLYTDLESALGTQWATFIVAVRQNGPPESITGPTDKGTGGGGGAPKDSPGAGQTEEEAPVTAITGELDLSQKGKYTIPRVLDLIGVKVKVKFVGDDKTKTLESPFANIPGLMNSYLPKLMDYVTATQSQALSGRININQAPRIVLQGIPGMTTEIVDQIVSQREPDPARRDPNHRHETWILAEGIVTLDQMKALSPFVTGGGCVFRTQVVGYFDSEGPDTRIEAILDAGKTPPRVIFWRDMSHLGRGYPREMLGVEWSE